MAEVTATPNKVEKTDAEWREHLTPEQYYVTRQKGTEPAFSGKLYQNHEDGTYRCVACGAELFKSDAKFESGSGWPSFLARTCRSRWTRAFRCRRSPLPIKPTGG